jgi:tRNA (guanine37-N1)-methyltransferase
MVTKKPSPFRIDIVTIFPKFFDGPLQESLLKKAQEKKILDIRVCNLRDYTQDRHKTVDDRPYGGGPGMVMKPEPIFEAIEDIEKSDKRPFVILLDPKGKPLTQKLALELSQKKHIALIAGHYEGVDHRVQEGLVDLSVCVGDFITMGGEAPALCLIEAVTRLIPGVIGNEASLINESFETDELEYPQYTRPREYRGMKVPDVLVSGNHKEVEKWRKDYASQLTREKRPDLKSRKSTQ